MPDPASAAPADPASLLLTLLWLHDLFAPLARPEITAAGLLFAAALWLTRPAAHGHPRALSAFLGALVLQMLWPRLAVPGDGMLTLIREVQLAPAAPALLLLTLPWPSPRDVLRRVLFPRRLRRVFPNAPEARVRQVVHVARRA
ncbi:hypothetical protein [Deinococcus enclensis]|uniref:Energy-coupling factor transporter transmembrane protein EcfT n=1 Tax=Deinococcus enclensis TaxID=1049582 RepID=A0ABT9MFW3_9DEIO|nr:hypothetical protein [Deinococcus enclensis]MDP9765441.1 hypothetical protein [Deinococcus enclensis]